MTPKMNSVGVIGLGSMGYGVAISCIAAGLETYGSDIRPEVCARLVAEGAADASTSPAAFAGRLDAVILLVVSATQCEEALFGEDGIAPKLRPGVPVVISATIAPADSRRLGARLAGMGLPMLDAPVSGGSIKAGKGQLTVMAAGAPETFDAVAPLLDAMAEKVYRTGTQIGDGAMVKTVHQLLAGVHIAVAAEAMALAARAGIPLELMYDVVTHSAGNSWMFADRMQHVLDGDYTPRSAVDIFVKDLGLVNATGDSLSFPLPLARKAYELFAKASEQGFGKLDDSAVIMNYVGSELPGTRDN
ncbi:L-threonate dehydrogenase [Ancylobacter mangrovi]|uniref:L-threonate dehydrogenase n=1 Tax=Ancylobacter mangrovi TaxID=2972472 RepID=UPI002161FF28|nr:L-threonate dehydrogenase [Ancylobacter mangrovi]MCS0502050.1 NAD(P)-dependent oxidoreductase [Ancylobacter mangrovi]